MNIRTPRTIDLPPVYSFESSPIIVNPREMWTQPMIPEAFDQWIGATPNYIIQVQHINNVGTKVWTLAEDMTSNIQQPPYLFWHHLKAQTTNNTITQPRLEQTFYKCEATSEPGQYETYYDVFLRILQEWGTKCIQQRRTWNAFRIDSETKVVTIALDYQRTTFFQVDLDDFIKYKLVMFDWHLIRGHPCAAINLIQLEDEKESKEEKDKYGDPIKPFRLIPTHWTHIHRERAYTPQSFKDLNDTSTTPPLEALPRPCDLIWLPVHAILLEMKFAESGLYQYVKHTDGNRLNNTRTNIIQKKEQLIPVRRLLHATVNGRTCRYRFRRAGKDKSWTATLTRPYERNIKQLHALRWGQTKDEEEYAELHNQSLTPPPTPEYSLSLVVFPYTEEELNAQQNEEEGEEEEKESEPIKRKISKPYRAQMK